MGMERKLKQKENLPKIGLSPSEMIFTLIITCGFLDTMISFASQQNLVTSPSPSPSPPPPPPEDINGGGGNGGDENGGGGNGGNGGNENGGGGNGRNHGGRE
ncbi:hypothetical protein LOK49_LG01G01265 [Camellia lanceoleosa]|uniref:Uncharacterized protein n=1 Tax=Camellia lanceoleosa TaxID=1840588 RepID=A0ACC0J3R3_9ERIC|nr:hypothetical protein LOK49_LG01G01265 [Camellia lanceoleosa]